MSADRLYLHEEVLLLALRDHDGTVAMGSMYSYAIGGALLAELLLHERVRVLHARRKKFVELAQPTPIGDEVLDECLRKIRQAKRRAALETWVSRFANLKRLKHRVAVPLVRRGILRAAEDKVLLIFTRKIYPEVNPEPEQAIIERLRLALFSGAKEVEARTVVLLALAHSADLLKSHFDKRKLKEYKWRLEKITEGSLIGAATKEAVEAVQAAIAIAAVLPAITVTTTS